MGRCDLHPLMHMRISAYEKKSKNFINAANLTLLMI